MWEVCIRAVLGVATGLVLTGCHAPVVRVDPRRQPEVAERDPTPRSYELAWSTQQDGWNRAVAITLQGDPLVVNGRAGHLLARHDGSVLATADFVCSPRAARFVEEHTGVLACDDTILEVELPGLSVRRAHELKARDFQSLIVGVDIQPHALAVGLRNGTVMVLQRTPPTYTPSFETTVDGNIETVALSPDLGALAVGISSRTSGELGSIEIWDLRSGKLRVRTEASNRSRVTAASFSPDSSMVFANGGTFEAGVLDATTGAWKSNYSVGSWVTTSTWLRPDLVAGAGSDGVLLFPVDRSETIRLEIPGIRPAMERIGASSDGSFFCSGDRSGMVACWTNRPVPPSTYVPRAPLSR